MDLNPGRRLNFHIRTEICGSFVAGPPVQDEVPFTRSKGLPSRGAVGRMVDRITFLSQPANQEVGDICLILDNQNPDAHASPQPRIDHRFVLREFDCDAVCSDLRTAYINITRQGELEAVASSQSLHHVGNQAIKSNA